MNKNESAKIFVPERVRTLKLDLLPISDQLAEFFGKHDIKIASDLRTLNSKLINDITGGRHKPFPELRHYILAFQECEDDKVILLTDTETAYRKSQQINQADKQINSFETILAKTIFIPMPARDWKISTLPISQELMEKIEISGCSKLYDLHGVTYSKFFKLKSFEKSNVIQLYAFITQLQSEKTFPSIEALVVKSQSKEKTEITDTKVLVINDKNSDKTITNQNSENFTQPEHQRFSGLMETIQIPSSLLDFKIDDFAPTKKLAESLNKEKIYYVKQLNGKSFYTLKQFLNLDAEGVAELRSIVEFAKKYARYAVFKSGIENIKKAAINRREEEQNAKGISNEPIVRQNNSEIGNSAGQLNNYFKQVAQNPNSEKKIDSFFDENTFSAATEFNLPELMILISEFVNNLPKIEREIFLYRFGGLPDEQILTYREIGEKTNLTSEGAYQRYLKSVGWLKNEIDNSTDEVLKKVYEHCLSTVCPLTPKLLVHLTDNKFELFQYPPGFYIRIFDLLSTQLPVLPVVENSIITLSKESENLKKEIDVFLTDKNLPVLLSELFNFLTSFNKNDLTINIFFQTVQHKSYSLIETNKVDELYIELKQ